MIVRFYNDPLLDRAHRIVRKGGQPLGFLYSEEIKEVVQPWAGEQVIEVKRRPFTPDRANTAPNLATISNEDVQAVYFVDVETVTPATVRMRLTLDWWGTYADKLTVTATTRRTPNAGGGYGIEARYTPQSAAVSAVAMGRTTISGLPASRVYAIAITFTCYRNNDWPVADGQPFQVTFISRDLYTGAQLFNANARNTMAPDVFYTTGGGASYTVVSVVRVQIIPSDLLFGWGASGVEGMFSRTETSTLWASVGTMTGSGDQATFYGSYGIAVLISGHHYGPQSPAYHGDYYIYPYTGGARNDAGARVFIGNRHNRIALPDINSDGATSTLLGHIFVTLAPGIGIVFELETGDGVIDISGFFDATTTYSSEKEAAYAAGDARALAAISAGVGSAVQIATGTARMAAGDVTGIAGIIAGGISAAGAVDNARLRGREVVTGGNHTALADAQTGLLSLLRVDVVNGGERLADAFWRGYLAITAPTSFAVTLSTLLNPPNLGPNVAAGAFALSDIHLYPTLRGELGSNLGNLLPVPDAATLETAMAELERGVLVISPTLTDLSDAWLLFPR